jgi:hypothetical protein
MLTLVTQNAATERAQNATAAGTERHIGVDARNSVAFAEAFDFRGAHHNALSWRMGGGGKHS